MWALILMKEGIIIMNNKHNPMKNFYSIKNNESISFDAEDALSLVFASCLIMIVKLVSAHRSTISEI